MFITLHRILFHIFFITVNTERKYLPVWETKTLFVHQRLLAWLKNDHFCNGKQWLNGNLHISSSTSLVWKVNFLHVKFSHRKTILACDTKLTILIDKTFKSYLSKLSTFKKVFHWNHPLQRMKTRVITERTMEVLFLTERITPQAKRQRKKPVLF